MRTVDADQAVAGIGAGQQIFVQGRRRRASVLLEALARRADEPAGTLGAVSAMWRHR